jgi:hypothetical protein
MRLRAAALNDRYANIVDLSSAIVAALGGNDAPIRNLGLWSIYPTHGTRAAFPSDALARSISLWTQIRAEEIAMGPSPPKGAFPNLEGFDPDGD